jgi:hypothetical protein
MIFTFGLYSFYWFYQTAKEMKNLTPEAEAAPTLWLILMFVPLGAFFSFYKYSELYEKVCTEKLNKWLIFVLTLVFYPAVWFLVQTDLNALADKKV